MKGEDLSSGGGPSERSSHSTSATQTAMTTVDTSTAAIEAAAAIDSRDESQLSAKGEEGLLL